jgi:flagellar secretion chaperone FliS
VNQAYARARYAADSVATASPAALLIRCYERIVRDIYQAEQAIAAQDFYTVNQALFNAQQIIIHLHSTLDADGWSGGQSLRSIYGYLLTQLISASASKDVRTLSHCRDMVTRLLDAWRVAAGQGPAVDQAAS